MDAQKRICRKLEIGHVVCRDGLWGLRESNFVE